MVKTRGPAHVVVTTIRFLRLTFGVLLVLLVPFVAAAQTVVTGQNNPAGDIPAVQAAVNGGGSVLLVGTFDFGDAGRVLLLNDVDILGEVDEAGNRLTTIRRGEWTFFTPLPTPMPPTTRGPKVSIQNIHFDGAKGTAIHLAHSGGALLQNNKVTGMRGRAFGLDNFDRTPIIVGPENTRPRKNVEMTPLLVSGDIQVFDNEVSVAGAEPATKTRGVGIFISMYVGADVRVERNLVTDTTRLGMNVLDGIADTNGRGSVVIAANTIISDVVDGFTAPGPRATIGILTGFNNNRPLGQDPNLDHIPVRVTNNYIELQGRTSMGIITIWNGAVLQGNTITVHADITRTTNRLNTSGGFLATTSDQVLRHNTIIGEGCNAIRIGGTTDGQERRDNVALANNISHFQAFKGGFENCADYWLELASHDNTVVGNSGSAIDHGVDNKITGLDPVAGGVGGAVSDAVSFSFD